MGSHCCKLCGKEFLLTNIETRDHFKAHSGLTHSEYYWKHVAGKIMDEKDVHEADEEEDKEEKDDTGTNSANVWADQCQFACFCKYTTKSKQSFCQHSKKVHDIKLTDYKEKYGDPMVKETLHECKICSRKVLCNALDLRSHVHCSHGLNVSSYYQMYIKDSPGEKYPKTEEPKDDETATNSARVWADKCRFS